MYIMLCYGIQAQLLYLYNTLILVLHFTCTAHLCLLYKALMYILSSRNTIQSFSISNTGHAKCHMKECFTMFTQKSSSIRPSKNKLLQIFFAIVLQCNSTFRIALQHNSKTKYQFFYSICLFLSLYFLCFSVLSPSLPLYLSFSHSLFLLVCSGGMFMVDLGVARS